MTVNHDLMVSRPVSLKYRQLFVKSVIKQLEWHDIPVCPSMATSYAHLISQVNSRSDFNLNYVNYIMSDGQTISLLESDNLVIDGTTGLRSWSAAKHLAQFIEQNRCVVDNKNVLELGSGVGLTGIYILKTCSPSHLTFSDHHSVVLEVLKNNIDNNKVCSKSSSFKIDWNDCQTIDNYLTDNDPEVIIAADVVFDPEVTVSLCRVVNHLLKNKPRICYICCTHRSDESVQYFLDIIANEYKLNAKEVFVSKDTNDLKSFCFDSFNTKCSIFSIKSD